MGISVLSNVIFVDLHGKKKNGTVSRFKGTEKAEYRKTP